MLTDERLKKIEEDAQRIGLMDWATAYYLFDHIRTLQQQNKQLVDTVETAIMWFNSGELFIKASQMRTMLTHIQSFQGGTDNA